MLQEKEEYRPDFKMLVQLSEEEFKEEDVTSEVLMDEQL